MRLLCVLLLAWPGYALAAWQTLDESADGVRMIDLARVERQGDTVHFHERLVLPAGQVDPASLRPRREVLERRVLACRTGRVATLSRAVFSDQDALIEHRATRLQQAVWQRLPADDVRLSLLCRLP